MTNINVIKLALAASLAAGALCFATTAAGVSGSGETATVAEPAPAGPATATPFTAPRYFNSTPPREDNPTNPPGTWEVYPSPTTKYLRAVDFVDANNGWAVGKGVALRYKNGSWDLIPGHNGHYFGDLDMVSLDDGWAVGWDSNKERTAIWRWNGSDWEDFKNPRRGFYCIDMIDASHGWIGGVNQFLRYNGSSWVDGGSSPNVISDVQMNSDTDGRGLGGDYIMRRVGNNWVQEATSSSWNLVHIFMLNNNSGWATGQYLTTEKGMILKYDGTWQVNKVFGEVYCVFGIWALDNNSVWASGPKNSNPPWGGTFFYYDGSVWLETENPDPEENVVYRFFFFNEENGWGVGSGGRIWRYKPKCR